MTRFQASGVAAAVALLAALCAQEALAQAQSASSNTTAPAESTQALPTVTVRASADASAQGLSPAYPGGQVARGGRAGILGTRDNMDTPFSITAYTNELIQDKQARSVGDVLQNDPAVRVARGFGNFQESYFIRGFLLSSDDVAYNGLYSLLPRQYIATELFERVEVLHGASAFLNGVNPGGGGIGGAINLLPKRAPNDPLTRVTTSIASGSQVTVAADVARRFGPDQSTGIRVNTAIRDGGTAVDDEKSKLQLGSVGLDWRSRDVRLSGDLGWQDNKLNRTRTNVTLGTAVTKVPDAPDNTSNWAQDWSYSNEKDVFGTLRGEYDIAPDVTAWAAFGARRSDEANSLANISLTNGTTGAATTYRFDNTRKDSVNTGEVGLRGKLRTGAIGHEWVASGAYFELDKKTAYAYSTVGGLSTNLYSPVDVARPGTAVSSNVLADPKTTGRTRLSSFAIGDTLSVLGDDLLVTLGLRHQQLTDVAYGANEVQVSRYSQERTSPVVGAVFKVSRAFSVYANYIQGLSKGDTAPSTGNSLPANPGEALAPYVSKQKEVGLKYDGGRLGADVAFFSTKKPRSLTTAANVFTSEGEDRHQGLELSVHGQATKAVRVLGGVTWLDAKQEKTGMASTEGKRVIGVPRLQSNVGAEWDVPGVRGLALDGRLVYTGSSYANAANTLKVPGWTRLDVGARYITDIQGHAWTWRARVENLADRDYWASVGGYPNAGYLVAGNPRTVSLSASVDF